MADDASIRVLAEPNILLPNQGFIDMYNMPNKWLQIHSSRHRTTQASSIFVLLSAFQLLLFASSLCCTACRIQTKFKKKWLQWLKMCVRLQSWDYSISPLISTVAGSWWAFSTKLQMALEKTETLKWMELHNLWRKMRHSLQSGGAILWWQWRSLSCSD